MDRAPKEPGKRASDLQPADFDDRGFPSDCREVALMTIDESWRLWSAGESVPDQVGNITALLFCGRRQSRHRLAVPAQARRDVANDEDFGVARYGKIAFHGNAPCRARTPVEGPGLTSRDRRA